MLTFGFLLVFAGIVSGAANIAAAVRAHRRSTETNHQQLVAWLDLHVAAMRAARSLPA